MEGRASSVLAARLELDATAVARGGQLGYLVINTGELPILLGEAYSVERFMGKSWCEVPLPYMFRLWGRRLAPGARSELIAQIPNAVPPGRYRLCKRLSVDRDPHPGWESVAREDIQPIEVTTEFSVTGGRAHDATADDTGTVVPSRQAGAGEEGLASTAAGRREVIDVGERTGVKDAVEQDPVLRLLDLVLGDLAVGGVMYVGRRREDGDARSFVIQTGEEGRHRLALPDLSSDASIEACMTEAQAHVSSGLGVDVPRCPQHDHQLIARSGHVAVGWECPDGAWRCEAGAYADGAWPRGIAASTMAPVLVHRLRERGIGGWHSLGVRFRDGEW
ncbi:MAG: hypothetical protein M3065_21495, partial [Actinomycetota bacterium]|nr:hypothetical protein [Actinomycetota bacterium]